MLTEIWITPNGTYNFYAYYPPQSGYFVLKNGEFEGIYDSLEECRECTVDWDNQFGDNAFSLPE